MDIVSGSRALTPEREPLRHVDLLLLVCAVGLSVVGLLTVYSATHQSLAQLQLDPGEQMKRQVAWIALGFVVLLLASSVDYRILKVYAGFFYAACLVGLVLVQTPLGQNVKGAQRWFQVAGFQAAPSEYMKIGLIVMLAAMLSEIRSDELDLSDVFRATVIALIPTILVFLQPDIGTSIVLTAILVGVLVVAGATPRHLALLAVTAIVLAVAAFQLGIIQDYQVARLTGFLDPQSDAQTTNYNRQQSEIAIGAGGLTGSGYLHGTQTNLDFVPEQSTDFIFTVIGEEFGFVGAAFVLLLFALLIWRAIRIAFLSKDAFGTYVAAGIASMFAIQMFVNVGMVIGIMPITGIPLPFVSYGGSAMLTNLAAVGLLLNIHMRRFK
jgi:rod shape determining protein RodA